MVTETKRIFQASTISTSLPQDQMSSVAIDTHFVQRSAHLANLGAHYLSLGDDYSAYGTLKRALSVLQQATATDTDIEISSPVHPTSSADFPEEDQEHRPLPLAAISFECERNEKALFGTADEDDKAFYFVYSKPFVFDPSALDVANTPIYISIVIFNMTLLLLRRARADKDSTPALQKALRLFDMALVLLDNAPTAKHVDSTNLVVALLNNKVHVCYCMHQFDDAHESLAALSELLTAVLCTEGSAAFDETELNGIILNTLLQTDPTRLARAA